MPRFCIILLAAVAMGGCNSEIYVRDGVTDGDTFYLAASALQDPDPVLQSWVSYSLTVSACQLRSASDNPARAASFDCELTARRHLLERWQSLRREEPFLSDTYLDLLAQVDESGYLAEYVAYYFGKSFAHQPEVVKADAFDRWRKNHLAGHRQQTRLIGSWNYSQKVRSLAGNP